MNISSDRRLPQQLIEKEMQNIMEKPDVRGRVITYITFQDLVSLIQVSRRFYSIFQSSIQTKRTHEYLPKNLGQAPASMTTRPASAVDQRSQRGSYQRPPLYERHPSRPLVRQQPQQFSPPEDLLGSIPSRSQNITLSSLPKVSVSPHLVPQRSQQVSQPPLSTSQQIKPSSLPALVSGIPFLSLPSLVPHQNNLLSSLSSNSKLLESSTPTLLQSSGIHDSDINDSLLNSFLPENEEEFISQRGNESHGSTEQPPLPSQKMNSIMNQKKRNLPENEEAFISQRGNESHGSIEQPSLPSQKMNSIMNQKKRKLPPRPLEAGFTKQRKIAPGAHMHEFFQTLMSIEKDNDLEIVKLLNKIILSENVVLLKTYICQCLEHIDPSRLGTFLETFINQLSSIETVKKEVIGICIITSAVGHPTITQSPSFLNWSLLFLKSCVHSTHQNNDSDLKNTDSISLSDLCFHEALLYAYLARVKSCTPFYQDCIEFLGPKEHIFSYWNTILEQWLDQEQEIERRMAFDSLNRQQSIAGLLSEDAHTLACVFTELNLSDIVL